MKNEDLIYNQTLVFCNNDVMKANYLINNSFLLKYLVNKTKALNSHNGDVSKSRLSLGNLYAIYVVVEDYIKVLKQGISYDKYEGMSFSPALARMRSLLGGSKLQNHPLNSRCNDEFKKFFSSNTDLIPIVRNVQSQKYWVEPKLLLINVNNQIIDISSLVINIIDKYSYLIFKRLIDLITSIETVSNEFNQTGNSKDVINFIHSLLKPNVDARTFELVSFVILKYYYRTTHVYFGYNPNTVQAYSPELYKTGRTNANDGGIDYLLKPLGRVFQVTEVTSSASKTFNKYFLDIEKLNHYPITFVIKTNQDNTTVMDSIKKDIYTIFDDQKTINLYLNCFEEIITIPNLINCLNVVISNGLIGNLLNELAIQTQLEFNMIDSGN